MRRIPIIHGSVLIPAVAILDEIGASTDELRRRERLPRVGSATATTYIPLRSAFAFTKNAADAQGIQEFGYRIAERVQLEGAGRWGPRVSTAVTLHHAIQIMSDWIGLDMPAVRIGLERRGDREWLWREHRPFGRDMPGYSLGQQYILRVLVDVVRRVEGPDWCPTRLELDSRAGEWGAQRPDFLGDAQIQFDAARIAIELPKGSLRRRLSIPGPTGSGPAPAGLRKLSEPPASDLKGSLHQILKGMVYDYPLTPELGAKILSCSERTLRRRLASEATSWREVADRVRLETALDLMDDPSVSMADVAGLLGHSQYPHFYRAFKRWTGESPGAYRKNARA
ncbi:MAG: helix-turn-helix domain-containing protein [Longimicrobiales bacterium]